MAEKLDKNDKLFLSALAAIREEKYNEAIGILNTLLEENPQDSECLLILSECYAGVGDLLNALVAIKRAHKLNPRDLHTLASLGILYSHFHIHDLAINALQGAISLGAKEENIYLFLARSFFLSGDLEATERILKAGLNINPSWNKLEHALGIHYLFVKNFDEALRIARKLEERDHALASELSRMIAEDSPERDKIQMEESRKKAKECFQRGLEFMRGGEIKEAIRELINSLDSDGEMAIAFTQLGFLLDQYGLVDEGLFLHKWALKIDPSLPDAYNNLGYVMTIKGEHEEAIWAYKKALELKPDFVQAHNSLGTLYDHLGQYEKGLYHFEKAIEIEPDRFNTLLNLGYVYGALGRTEEAISAYKKARQLYPGAIEPRLFMGTIFLDMESYDAAEKEFWAALEIDPQSYLGWYGLGKCYLAKGDSHKFTGIAEKIASLFPRRPDEIFLMAELMEHIEKERAIEYWRKYIEIAERYPLNPMDVAYAKARLTRLIGPRH